MDIQHVLAYTNDYYLCTCPGLLALKPYMCYKVTSGLVRHVLATLEYELAVGLQNLSMGHVALHSSCMCN